MAEKRPTCAECGGCGFVDEGIATARCKPCAGTGVYAPDCDFPRVEACIQGAMRQFPGATGRYYEEAHQRLAPLARDMERELIAAHSRIRELESDRDSWAEQASQRVADWEREHELRIAAERRVSEVECAGQAVDERAAFEEWVKSLPRAKKLSLAKGGLGGYLYGSTADTFKGWQARASLGGRGKA